MYQNEIYICIFWYSKICWFLVKKGTAELLWYVTWFINFLDLFRYGITVISFIIVRYVWEDLGMRSFWLFPFGEQPRKDPSWIWSIKLGLCSMPWNCCITVCSSRYLSLKDCHSVKLFFEYIISEAYSYWIQTTLQEFEEVQNLCKKALVITWFFGDLFHEPLNEWNNSKISEKKKILTILY